MRIENRDTIIEEISSLINNVSDSEWGFIESKRNLVYWLNKALDREPVYPEEQHVREKIVILFMVMEFSTFPSVQMLYEAARKDERFEADLVYVPFGHENRAHTDAEEMAAYKAHGYQVIHPFTYDLLSRSPDVAVFIKPYDLVPDKYYIAELYKCIEYSVFIRYCPDTIDVVGSDFFDKSFFRSSLNFFCRRNYVSSKKTYAAAHHKAWEKEENFYLDANPRYDFDKTSVANAFRSEAECIQDCANGRNIIFWNSNHQMTGNDPMGTFCQMGKDILDMMKDYPDIFFIWRPHPLFWNSLRQMVSDEAVAEIKAMLDTCENMILDEYDSYLPAFYMSDALLSDMSSLIGEYLNTGKPICVLISKAAEYIYPPEFYEVLYTAENKETVRSFLQLISDNADPLKEKRVQCAKDSFALKIDNDTTVSEKILNDICVDLSKGGGHR